MRGEVRAGRREGVRRWRRKQHARGRPDSRLRGRRARAERTANMKPMSATLEVSKLSGWLKAYAFCRVEGRSMRCGGRCGPGGGRAWGGGGASGILGKGPIQGLGGPQGTRGAHIEHGAHARDLGGVKAQRLVERRRDLPSRKGRACEAGRGAGREAVGREAAAAQAARTGKARLKAVGAQGTRGAHIEHPFHGRDLGGVKAQRLVEHPRALPSRREGHMRCGARCGPGGGRV